MNNDLSRRALLASAAGAAVMASVPAGAATKTFPVTRTDAEWRAMLTPLEYHVMREEGTERAFSSPLDKFFEAGTYHCRGCGQHVYSAEQKYDSGTGWPSFWSAVPGAIGTKKDRKLLRVRTECHCSTCGSHFGHVFADGPAPTGTRHCLNGVSLVFKAA